MMTMFETCDDVSEFNSETDRLVFIDTCTPVMIKVTNKTESRECTVLSL